MLKKLRRWLIIQPLVKTSGEDTPASQVHAKISFIRSLTPRRLHLRRQSPSYDATMAAD